MDYLKTTNFELSRVFVGKVGERKYFLYSIEQGEKYGIIPESYVLDATTRSNRYSNKVYIYDKSEVEIICSLQELVEKEGIESLLLNVRHQYVSTVNRARMELIKKVIANKKSKFASSLNKLKDLADFTTSIVCDELGFNIAVHPMTSIIDSSKVQNVAIPAIKLKKFKEALSTYIYIQFLSEEKEVIFQDKKERSSCIESSLNYSHIESTRELLHNEVSVQPDLRTGTVSVRRELLKPEFMQEATEYQKVHILSAK